MPSPSKDSAVSLTSFFARRNLPSGTQDECDAFARAAFPSKTIRSAPFQGYCSYTLIVGDDQIVQFRPQVHGLDVEIVAAAHLIFGDLVPETKLLGSLESVDLQVYHMKKLEGTALSDLRASGSVGPDWSFRRQMVKDFARLQARSWHRRQPKEEVLDKRKVGSSLRWRLDMMQTRLPSRLRKFASRVNWKLQDIENLPWVMSHGDFLPANVLVCPNTGDIRGLLDWAEAEWLPFGIGIYGLEELLGQDVVGRFVYYPEARQLRILFWHELLLHIPELTGQPGLLDTIRHAQILGILLWHGIAFDDGRLDRVVEQGIDDGEIQRLDATLLDSLSGLNVERRRSLSEKWRSWYGQVHNATVGKLQVATP